MLVRIRAQLLDLGLRARLCLVVAVVMFRSAVYIEEPTVCIFFSGGTDGSRPLDTGWFSLEVAPKCKGINQIMILCAPFVLCTRLRSTLISFT